MVGTAALAGVRQLIRRAAGTRRGAPPQPQLAAVSRESGRA